MARQPFNNRWAQGVESQDNLNTFKAPGDVRINSGWEGGQDKDAPPAGQENWWHNRVDTALQGVERNGAMSWHPQAIYGMGAPTYGPDGNYYESIVADNTGNNPSSTAGFWRYCGPSFFSGHVPGDLKMVAHNNIPTAGWLKCNGAILSRASYALLFDSIGTIWNSGGETSLQFRLPDFRGVFLRGFSDGSSIDSGRAFGSFQADELKSHRHELRSDLIGAQPLQGGTPDAIFNQANELLGYTENTGGIETRPVNRTVSYWIKY